MHRSNNNSRTNFSGEPATARASSSAAWAPLPPALAGHEREGKTDYQETNLTWCEKIEGHYGQFIYQIHEKEIEKRGKYIQWHEKSSCTCLEFYFCKVDVRNTKLRSTIFEVPNMQFSRISQVLQLVLQLSFRVKCTEVLKLVDMFCLDP